MEKTVPSQLNWFAERWFDFLTATTVKGRGYGAKGDLHTGYLALQIDLV